MSKRKDAGSWTPEKMDKCAKQLEKHWPFSTVKEVSAIRHGAASLRRWEALKAFIPVMLRTCNTVGDNPVELIKNEIDHLEREP